MRTICVLAVTLSIVLWEAPIAEAQQPEPQPPPVIDAHLHALPADFFGPPPAFICPNVTSFPGHDPHDSLALKSLLTCSEPLWSPETDEEVMHESLEALRRHNVVGIASGPLDHVRRWQAAAPDRIIPGVIIDAGTSPDSVRSWLARGEVSVLGEVVFQYAGVASTDTMAQALFSLAEEFDVPVGLHMGPGPPGAAYLGYPRYRAHLSDPLSLEEVLVEHPRLRLYVMHAGWPMGEAMVALLYAHPQVYVDVGVINWVLPRREFHDYLRRLVQAGFAKRILFGSDQMLWAEGIGIAIESITSADFLTEEQKRDILYDNALRFFRIDEGMRPRQ